MATPFSLYDELTAFRSDKEYPATDLIKTLVKTIGLDVCSQSFKRNTQSAYFCLHRARDALEVINGLIARVENEMGWESYDQYTRMIDPMEDTLFKFALTAEKEATVALDTTSVQSSIDSISLWLQNRENLRGCVVYLTSDPLKGLMPDSFSDIGAIQKHDDLNYLLALSNTIKEHAFIKLPRSSRGSASAANLLKGLNELLGKLSRPSGPIDGIFVMSIQFGMIVKAMMDLGTSNQSDPELRSYLRDATIWNEAQAFLSAIFRHIDNASLAFVDLEKKWANFLELLKKFASVVLPATYLALRILVSKIRRPFLAQGIVLVSGCFSLAQYFEKLDKKTYQVLETFELAIDATTKALNQAISAVKSITGEISDEDKAAAVKAFADAEAQIQACSKTFNLDLTTWINKMDDAKKKDNAHMKRFQEIQHKEKPSPPKGPQIQVTISLRDGRNKSEGKYTVDSSTPLSALLWKETLRVPELSSRIPRARFTTSTGTVVQVGTQVASLVQPDGVVSLTLTVQ